MTEEGSVWSLYDLDFSVDKDSVYVGGLHGSYMVWRYVKDDFAESATDESDKGEGYLAVEVLYLCGKIRVDDALRSELRDGYATWCSVDGQVSLYKQRVDTVSP